MIHLTEEMILAVRDREPVADEVLAHLEECGACARALEDARSRAEAVEQALAALTVPPTTEVRAKPVIGQEGSRGSREAGAGRVVAEVAGGRGHPDVVAETGARVVPIGRRRRDVVSGAGVRGVPVGRGRRDVAAGDGARVLPAGRGRRDAIPGARRRGAGWTARWLGRAAVLALVGAGTLSALPGPFHGWIPRVFSPGPAPVVPTAPAPDPPGQVGGRMEVAGGPVFVRLENVAPGTIIDVRRVAGRAVGVLAATGSEFSYGGGEVRAAVAAGPVAVELPDGVVPVTLVVNGEVHLVVDAVGMEVRGSATVVDGEGLVTLRVPN